MKETHVATLVAATALLLALVSPEAGATVVYGGTAGTPDAWPGPAGMAWPACQRR